jgi:hypothetical protein
VAIVKGDLLSGSTKLATCELLAAGFYSWFISNQAATDDFGRGRLAPASLWAKVFEKRIDSGMTDVTPALIVDWFAEWERVGLVKLYHWGGEVWFEWVKFQGVAPTKQRYHRAPEPPGSNHTCSHRCSRSGKKFSKVLIPEPCTTADVFGSRESTGLGTYSVPSVFRSPPSPTSSVPLLPLQTTDTGAATPERGAAGPESASELDLPPEPDPTSGNGHRPRQRRATKADPWPIDEALADYDAHNGAGAAPRGEIAGQLTPLVRAQAQAAGRSSAEAWAAIVRPRWRAYWGLDGGTPTDHPSPSAADFRKHFAGRGNGKANGRGPSVLGQALEEIKRELGGADAGPDANQKALGPAAAGVAPVPRP